MGLTGTTAFPNAIIATTVQPSVAIIGDSIQYGIQDTTGDQGATARSVGPYMGYTNFGISGDTVARWIAGNDANRMSLLRFFSAVVTDYGGVNDSARLAPSVIADMQTLERGIRAAYPTIRHFEIVRIPTSISTDRWTTITNQTAVQAPYFRAINAYIKAESYTDGYFDLQSALDASGNIAVWNIGAKGPAMITSDSVHPNTAGNILIRDSGVISAGAFTRPGGAAPARPGATSTAVFTVINCTGSTYDASTSLVSGCTCEPADCPSSTGRRRFSSSACR